MRERELHGVCCYCLVSWRSWAKRRLVHLGKLAEWSDGVHCVAAHACFLGWRQWVRAEVVGRGQAADLQEAQQVIVQSNAWLLRLQGERHSLEEELQLTGAQVSVLTEALQQALKAKDSLVVELQESYRQIRVMQCECLMARGFHAAPHGGALLTEVAGPIA